MKCPGGLGGACQGGRFGSAQEVNQGRGDVGGLIALLDQAVDHAVVAAKIAGIERGT